jgi:hypothetical protein
MGYQTAGRAAGIGENREGLSWSFEQSNCVESVSLTLTGFRCSDLAAGQSSVTLAASNEVNSPHTL